MSDPYVLLLPPGTRWRSARRARSSDLDGLALIGSSTCSSGLEAEQILRDAGHAVEYAFRSDDNGTLQGLVAAGFGAALVPLLAVMPGRRARPRRRDRAGCSRSGDLGRLAPRPPPLTGSPCLRGDRPGGQRGRRARPRRAVEPIRRAPVTPRVSRIARPAQGRQPSRRRARRARGRAGCPQPHEAR